MYLGCAFVLPLVSELSRFLLVFSLFIMLDTTKWKRGYALVQDGVGDHEAISIRCFILFFLSSGC